MAPAWVVPPLAKNKSLTIGTTLRGAHARDARKTSVSHSHRPHGPLRICKISSRVGIRAPHIRRQHLIQGRSTQIALQIPESVTDTG